MSFLNPLFLFALLTIAVPLLIYLWNVNKPKKVRFSTLAFFNSLKTSALKRIRIKRWLLLAIRCLAIIVLVIAASRPFLPSGFGWVNESAPKVAAILVDNSPSMDRVDRDGPYIEQALNLAIELAATGDSDDRFIVEVTNGQPLNSPLLSSRGAAGRLSEIETVNAGNYLADRISGVVEKLNEAGEPNKIIYLITDGQETQFSVLEESGIDELSDIHLQVIKVGGAEPSNTGFASVEIEGEGQAGSGEIQIRAVVENFGNQVAGNQFLSLLIDDELISQQPFEIAAGGSEEFLFTLPVQQYSIPVELLIEGDELGFDNRYFAAVQLPELRRVLAIRERNGSGLQSYLTPMLEVMNEDNESVEVTFAGVSDFSSAELREYDAFILDGLHNVPDYVAQSLIDRVQEGAGLLFLPSADGNINSYNRLLGFSNAGRYVDVTGSYGSFETINRMAVPNEGHPILDTIFDEDDPDQIRLNVPEIFYLYNIEARSSGSSFTVLRTQTGEPLFQEARAGNGMIIYSAIGSDPGWSNFPIKPFFAPFLYRTINYLARGEGASLNNHILGWPFKTVIHPGGDQIGIEKNGEMILPETRQTFRGMEVEYDGVEWEPGWAEVKTGEKTFLYSVNQDAMESQLGTLSNREMEALLGIYFNNVSQMDASAGQAGFLDRLETASMGREIWHWFIIIAIILLLLESFISRYYKAETIK